MTRLRHLLTLPAVATLVALPTQLGQFDADAPLSSVASIESAAMPTPAVMPALAAMPTFKAHAQIGIEIDAASVVDGRIAANVSSLEPVAIAEVAMSATGSVRMATTTERVSVSSAPSRVTGEPVTIVGAGEVTATIVVINGEGERLIASDTVWVDRTGGRVIVSDIGTQDLALRRADAAAQLDVLPAGAIAAMRSDALGGGLEPVEVVRAQAVSCAAGLVCVTGTAMWTDRDGVTRPIPGADIEVREANVGGDDVIATTRTADDGSFSANVDNLDPEGGQRDIFVRLLAAGDGFAFVRNDSSAGFPTQFVDSSIQTDVANGSLPISFVTNNVDDNHTVFSLHHSMVLAREYLPALRATPFPDVDIVFPAGGSFFDGQRIYMLRPDRWDWDVMLHEYGHFVAAELGIEDSPGGSHSGRNNLADDFGRDKDEGIRLAWGEGLATYFAVFVQREANAAALGIFNVGDARYQDTEDTSIDNDLEADNTLGEDNEVTVMSVLWDVYDDVDDGLDEVSFGALLVWSALDDADPSTLSDAYDALAPNAGPEHNAVNCAFSQMNVAPRLTGAATTAIEASTASPLFEWSPGNGGNDGENDVFDVEFRDASNTMVLHRSGAITATTYQASNDVWSAVKASAGGQINVTVVGTETQNPVTGPYRSCARRFSGGSFERVPLFNGLDPVRFVDTRSNGDTVDGEFAAIGQRQGGDTLRVDVAGRGDVPTDARSVIVNLTAARPDDAGFVTAYDCAGTQPLASSLNFIAQSNVANEVIVSLDADGSACFFTSVDMHLVIDVVGYVADSSLYRSVEPARFLETRTDGQQTIDGMSEGDGELFADTEISLPIAGRADIPEPVAAVVVNVTAVGADRTGFVPAPACEPTLPLAASLNYVAGVNRGNELVVPVDGSGNICLYTSTPVHLTADVVGYIPLGSELAPTLPSRLLDSRSTGQTVDGIDEAGGVFAGGSQRRVQISGRAGVASDASSAVLNVGAVQPDGTGFVTMWPCTADRPTVSSLNHVDKVNGSNEIIAKLDDDGGVCLYVSNDTHLTVDLMASLAS